MRPSLLALAQHGQDERAADLGEEALPDLSVDVVLEAGCHALVVTGAPAFALGAEPVLGDGFEGVQGCDFGFPPLQSRWSTGSMQAAISLFAAARFSRASAREAPRPLSQSPKLSEVLLKFRGTEQRPGA